MTSLSPWITDSVEVPLGDIEKEVAHLIRAEQDEGGPPIQRARMSNLVIYCDQADLAETIASQIPEIVIVHPCRVILIVSDRQADFDQVSALVRVQTRYVHGGRQEVASEQIRLQADGRGIDHAPNIVRGLLIGDLPTNLWWASQIPPPLAGPLLYDLSEQSQQIIFDSLGWGEPHRGIAAVAGWLTRVERGASTGRWRVAADINWRRLKPWRRLFAQALDPSSEPGAFESISEVRIEHGPSAVTQAWLLASWLASRLNWIAKTRKVEPSQEITWNLQAPSGPVRLVIQRLPEGPPVLQRIQIDCELCGELGTLNLLNEDQARLSVKAEGRDVALRTITLKPQPLSELIGRQLTDRARDPVFHQVMATAQVLARDISS